MRYFDLPPDANRYFPRHGAIEGPTGVKLLRLPVLRLYQFNGPTYRYFLENKIAGIWLQTRSPFRTLRQLAVCLRDLHRQIRDLLSLNPMDPFDKAESERSQNGTRYFEGVERTEILLISAFILLRRLADDLMRASRPFMFQHWKSAPEEMKTAVQAARDGGLTHLKPLGDLNILTDALLNHTAWLDRLRDVRGIRDILAHKPHILQVGTQGTQKLGETNVDWRVMADLVQEGARGIGLWHVDLLPALVECLDGACKFMTRLSESVGLVAGYEQGDYVMLTGRDSDIVGFWPRIDGGRMTFPLID